jgi:hypothetical protein
LVGRRRTAAHDNGGAKLHTGTGAGRRSAGEGTLTGSAIADPHDDEGFGNGIERFPRGIAHGAGHRSADRHNVGS